MAQKRMLSKRLTESDKIQALRGNDRARFLYAALLPHTDRAGRVNVNPLGLKGTILEGFEYTIEEIDQALFDLAAAGLVTLYANGKHKRLAEYVKFAEFNHPHPKEAPSELPGPEDPGSDVLDPSGNLPGNLPTGSLEGPTTTPSLTPTETEGSRAREASDDTSPEAKFTRVATTGRSEASETARARAVIRRLAGPKFANENEGSMPAWSRHATDRIEMLWAASAPSCWPAESGKRRTWFFTDLLNEERYPPGDTPPPAPAGGDLYQRYIDRRGSLDGEEFEVIGLDMSGEKLMTSNGRYLTPEQVEEAIACLAN